MSLIKCKKCGEIFSDSYKTCPFCEEDDAYYGGRATKRRRRAETPRRKAPSILGPVVVLVLILLVLLVQIFQTVGTFWATRSDKRLRK